MVGDSVGLPNGIGGTLLSGESWENSLDPKYELRFDGGCGEVMFWPLAGSVSSSPDSDPDVDERSEVSGSGLEADGTGGGAV
jgi:hypothetical protein